MGTVNVFWLSHPFFIDFQYQLLGDCSFILYWVYQVWWDTPHWSCSNFLGYNCSFSLLWNSLNSIEMICSWKVTQNLSVKQTIWNWPTSLGGSSLTAFFYGNFKNWIFWVFLDSLYINYIVLENQSFHPCFICIKLEEVVS